MQESIMTTPLTITSLSQGRLNAAPKSEAEYWARFTSKASAKPQPFWRPVRIVWPRWTLRLLAGRN
jgi:hypothetical protein